MLFVNVVSAVDMVAAPGVLAGDVVRVFEGRGRRVGRECKGAPQPAKEPKKSERYVEPDDEPGVAGAVFHIMPPVRPRDHTGQ